MILNTRNSPSVMRGGILLERDISLLGYLSTYSLNLVILACILSPNGFELNEQDYTNSKNYDLEFKAWDKLVFTSRFNGIIRHSESKEDYGYNCID